MSNPIAQLREECQKLIYTAIFKTYSDIEVPSIKFTPPPNLEMGEISTPICFQLASMIKSRPSEIAERIVAQIETGSSTLVESVDSLNGYINFHSNIGNFSRLVLETAMKDDLEYGFLKTRIPEKVMVEHTSANPNGPIHIGNARNSILGDALAEILKHRGYDVETHFLVNDMGRQVAMATYGWKLLDMPEPIGRPDLWVGTIYASVNVLIEVNKMKSELQDLEPSVNHLKISEINKELYRYAAAAHELRERDPIIFDALTEKIGEEQDPESSIVKLNTEYEEGKSETRKTVRKLINHCLSGFEQILGKIGINFDMWDYESDLVWRNAAEEILGKLRKTNYVFYDEGALILDCDKIAEDYMLKKRWGLNPNHTIPRLVLVRSDGTTLYTLRDIAYSMWKFQRVNRVINVIGYEQTLAQLQLRIALAALGETEMGDKQTHFAYEFVKLPGVKMSGRLGKYITLNEVIDRSAKLAYNEVLKRSPDLPEEKKREISEIVGFGAVKYALLSVDPMKTVIFDWAKALNFEMNSAPFIQYSHARACNILKKVKKRYKANFGLLKDRRERDLVMMIARLPEVFEGAANELKPSDISAYANALADKFNSFYAALPVLKANPSELLGARLILVETVRIVLRNTLTLLGIEAPAQM